LQSQDPCEGLRVLPRKAMECEMNRALWVLSERMAELKA